MTVASGGLGWYVSGRVLRPVRAITETARRASDQHLGERLALTGAQDGAQRSWLTPSTTCWSDWTWRSPRSAVRRERLARAAHPLTVMRTAIDVVLAKPNRTTGDSSRTWPPAFRRSVDRSRSAGSRRFWSWPSAIRA